MPEGPEQKGSGFRVQVGEERFLANLNPEP
jgi:hypothetical protein